jgi:hypothetical protein
MDLLCDNREWLNNIGDLGLMLWLWAAVAPGEMQDLYDGLNPSSALTQFDIVTSPTMELAWFLTGLSYAAPLLPRNQRESTKGLAGEAYGLLVKNQGESGFFGHQSTSRGLRAKIRGSIGSFADQVYPIYALTQYARTYGENGALDRARRCADAICRAQGVLGQWWWHYEASSGRVFQRYPVYSVHQDGMAPMCLWAVGDATGHDYSEWIYKGLSWIYGNNEIECDMRDSSSGMIWRCLYSRGLRRRTREVLDVLGMTMDSTGDLSVLCECRPYHLGWLLYAFAGRE